MNSTIRHKNDAPASRHAPSIQHLPRHVAVLIWGLLALAFCMIPLADFVTVKASAGGESGARYSLVVRGFFVTALVFATLIGGEVKRASLLRGLLAAISICAAAVMCLRGSMTGQEFAEQAIFILKVFSFFVYIAAFSSLSDMQRSKLEPFVLGALLVYAMTIIAGAVLSVEMFRSYQANVHIRSGYKGIVYAQNEASALMIAALGFAYSRVLRSGWSKLNALVVLILTAAALLVGTKAAAVGALAVMCVFFCARYRPLSATFRAGTAILALLVVAIVAYATVPTVRDAVDLSKEYFQYHYDRANGNAILTILLSGRDLKFGQVWADLGDRNYLALLTGGYPITRYFIEIDIPDLMLCLGLPLFCMYLISLRSEFVFERSDASARFGRLFFLVLLAVACTAGHTLNSAVTSPYLAFIALTFRRSS